MTTKVTVAFLGFTVVATPLVAKGADGMVPCPEAGVSPHIAFGGMVKMRHLEVGAAVPIIDTVGIICWTLSSLLPETVGKAGSCSVFGRTGDTFQGVPSVISLRYTPGGAFSTVPIGSID